MGPIKGSVITSEQMAKILQNEDIIKSITDVFNMHIPGSTYDNLGAFTNSNKGIGSLTTSKAKLGSVSGNYLGIAEGKTPAALTKMQGAAQAENAILRAVQALAADVPGTPNVPTTPSSPSVPKYPPGISVNPILQIMGKLLNGAQLATYSSDLNVGEDESITQYNLDSLRMSGGKR